MTSSKLERQTTLDIIYSSLSNPNATGNRFLSQLLTNAKEGYFNLNLLKGLVTELNNYPLAYLQHCINYERTHHPDQQRLELDHEQVQVRIARQTGDTAITNETDAFGFLVTPSSSSTPTVAEDTGKKRLRSPSPSDPPLEKQQKRSSATYFTPYQPSFNFKALADDEGSMDILPVVYDDGKFYQDASFFNASTAEKATKATPYYDKLDILPIGAPQPTGVNSTRSLMKEKTCWNCGLTDHELYNCPEPTNRQRVEVNRALFLTNSGGSGGGGGGRYYEELKYKDHVSGLEPGRLSENLRDALGMYCYEDEPPYYRAMRMHGYPPGYTGSYADQERVMKLVGGNQLDEDVPDLQIFDLEDNGIDNDGDDDDDSDDKIESVRQEQQDTKTHQERIRMVTYPGLYHTQRMSRQDQQELYYQQQLHRQQQHQHCQSSSYQQQQQQQQHYYEQYGEQQQYPSQTTSRHLYQHQAFSSYQQHYPQSSLSHYYQQSYYTAYDSSGHQPTYHQYDPAYTHYNKDHNDDIPPPPPPPCSHDDDIPPPPPPLDDIPPPPPPLCSHDDDIPPPPPPLDDIPPPPPPSHSIAYNTPSTH